MTGKMRYIRPFDPWKSPLCTCPFKYTLNVYTGCDHACVYCYITSYIRDPFRARVKRDLLRSVLRDIGEIDRRSFVALSYSSDPYPRIDEEHGITRKVIEIFVRKGVRFMILTKSDLFLRDLDLIKRGKCAIGITVTTIDEEKAKSLEPNAPDPKRRIVALRRAKKEGIPVYARIDPIIPFYTEEELEETIRALDFVSHITFSTLKMRPDIARRMRAKFPELMKKLLPLYVERKYGYWYLPRDLRLRILRKAEEMVLERGITFGSCREGYLSMRSCDGSHLIPIRDEHVVIALRAVSFVGFKKSGKTETILEVSKILKEKGLRVCVLKGVHGEIDVRGKDSEKFFREVDKVILLNERGEFAIFSKGKDLLFALSQASDCDVLLVEGMKTLKVLPKVYCLREERELQDLEDGLGIAISGEISRSMRGKELEGLKVYDPKKDSEELAELVLKKGFLLPGMNCGECGMNCYEMAKKIVSGERRPQDCKVLGRRVEVLVEGRRVPLKPWVQSLVENVIRGIISSLKGCSGKEKEVEIRIRGSL